MTISPHFLASAAVATAVTDNIYIAFLIGFAIHFILDAIPHLDPGTFHNVRIPGYKKEIDLETVHADNEPWPMWIYAFVAVELAVISLVTILLFSSKPNFNIIIAGGIGGIFVDVMDNPIFNFVLSLPVFKQIHFLHHRIHHDLDIRKWYLGLSVQLIIMGGALWYLLKF